MSDDIPRGVLLSDEELRIREAALAVQFNSAIVAIEELPDGYAVNVPRDMKSLAVVTKVVCTVQCL